NSARKGCRSPMDKRRRCPVTITKVSLHFANVLILAAIVPWVGLEPTSDAGPLLTRRIGLIAPGGAGPAGIVVVETHGRGLIIDVEGGRPPPERFGPRADRAIGDPFHLCEPHGLIDVVTTRNPGLKGIPLVPRTPHTRHISELEAVPIRLIYIFST